MIQLDSKDSIFICGKSVSGLAEKYGTPVYIYSEKRIVENYNRLNDALSSLPYKHSIFYAIKACSNPHIAKILIDCGAGIDAASPCEIELAKLLGVPNNRILFTGNNLSDYDIQYAVESKVVFNVDDEGILPRIFRFGVPEVLSFRINPGGDKTVTGLQTFGGAQAKFGIDPESAVQAYSKAKKKGIKRFGVHMMPGSCALDVDYFRENTRTLLGIAHKVSEEVGIEFEFIDLGGGLGIPYRDNQEPLNIYSVAKAVGDELRDIKNSILAVDGSIFMEPARYFVGDAGVLVGRVHSIKYREPKNIIGTDISMNVLARPAMYKEEGGFHRLLFNRRSDDALVAAGICGQVCENTDFWDKNRKVPDSVEINDLVVALDAGAYGYSMSYQYNGRLKPAEVLIDIHGNDYLIRERETINELIGNTPLGKDLLL
jgi:diaminopimelate decarboxylase